MFIGIGLDQQLIEKRLKRCFVHEKEMSTTVQCLFPFSWTKARDTAKPTIVAAVASFLEHLQSETYRCLDLKAELDWVHPHKPLEDQKPYRIQ